MQTGLSKVPWDSRNWGIPVPWFAAHPGELVNSGRCTIVSASGNGRTGKHRNGTQKCSLIYLSRKLLIYWCRIPDSNWWPFHYEWTALPTELIRHVIITRLPARIFKEKCRNRSRFVCFCVFIHTSLAWSDAQILYFSFSSDSCRIYEKWCWYL